MTASVVHDPFNVRLFELLANMTRLKNAATYDLTERFAARLGRMLDVTTTLVKRPSTLDVARMVAQQGMEVLQASAGFVTVNDGANRHVVVWRALTEPDYQPQLELSLERDGALGEALESREPVWLESGESTRGQFATPYDGLDEIRRKALLVQPLLDGPELAGALVLAFDTPRVFGTDDRSFAALLAESTAGALARAGMFQRVGDARHEPKVASPQPWSLPLFCRTVILGRDRGPFNR